MTNSKEDFFKESTLLDEEGQPELLWHGSRSNTLIQFDLQYEGTGAVSTGGRKYGGFFFANDKKGAEYYCYGHVPEEEIDTSKGEIFTEVYGDDNNGWFYMTTQRDDVAYGKKFKEAVKEYKKEHGESADLDLMEVEIDDEFEDLGNGGSYLTPEEAELAGEEFIRTHNECVRKEINPYLYPIHLRMKKTYIHDTNIDGFINGQELIKIVGDLNEGYDGIKIIDIFDGDRVMDVYIVFDPKNIKVLDKMNPDSCRLTIEYDKIQDITEKNHQRKGKKMDIKENYSTMTTKEKSANVYNLSRQIQKREEQISDEIRKETKIGNLAHHAEPIIKRDYALLSETQKQEIKNRGDGNIYGGDKYIGQTIFGVRDNLQSIDEYIAEIKESRFYKFFVKTVSNQAENEYLSTERVFHDFSAKYKTLGDINTKMLEEINQDILAQKLRMRDVGTMASPAIQKELEAELEELVKEKDALVLLMEEEDGIPLSMIRSIDRAKEGEYLIGHSNQFSESPEYDTISIEEARKIFDGKNISAEDFMYDIVPCVNEKYGLMLYSELVEKREPQKLFFYGMRSRPFGTGTYPENENFISAKEGETYFGEDPLSGRKYHNMLLYTSPLPKEDVENFQLDDIDYLNRGGERWDKIVSTTEYLAKREREDDFLSDRFFKAIHMDTGEFIEILKMNGIEDPLDLFKVIKNDLKAKEETLGHKETELSDKPSKKKPKHTKIKR